MTTFVVLLKMTMLFCIAENNCVFCITANDNHLCTTENFFVLVLLKTSKVVNGELTQKSSNMNFMK